MTVIRYGGSIHSNSQDQWFNALTRTIQTHSALNVSVIVGASLHKSMIRHRLTGLMPGIVTLSEWATQISGHEPLSESRRLMIFHTVLLRFWPELYAQHSAEFSQSVLHQLFNLFEKLPAYSLSPDDLRHPPFRRWEKSDILPTLYQAYRHEIDQSGGDELSLITHLTLHPPKAKLEQTHLFWYGHTELPIYQRRLVRSMMSHAASSTWHILWDPNIPQAQLAQPLWNWLSPLVTQDMDSHTPSLSASPIPVGIHHYASPITEISAILRQIRYQLHINHCSASHMGIVIPKQNPYLRLLLALAPEYEVPISHFQAEPLRKHPLFGLLTATIELLTGPISTERIRQFCQAPFLTTFSWNNQKWIIDIPAIESIIDPLPPGTSGIDRNAITQPAIQPIMAILDWISDITQRLSPQQFDQVISDLSERLSIPIPETIHHAFQEMRLLDTPLLKTWSSAGYPLQLVLSRIYLTSQVEDDRRVIIVDLESCLGIERAHWWVCGFQAGNWPRPNPDHWLIPPIVQLAAFPHHADAGLERYALWQLYRPETSVYLSLSPERGEGAVVPPLLGNDFTWTEEPPSALPELLSERDEISQDGPMIRLPDLHIQSPDVIQTLQNNTPHISATGIDTLSDCAHRYFLRHIMRLPSVFDPAQDIETREWGNLLHDIIADTLKRFQNAPPPDSASVHETLKKIAHLKWQPATRQHPVWLLKKHLLFGSSPPSPTGILHLISDYLSDLLDQWTPLHIEHDIEWPFDPTLPPIKGRIDAVFRHRTHPYFAIIDFKTGKSVPEKSDIIHFRRFQLPLYAQAIQAQYPSLHLGPTGYLHLYSESKAGYAIRLTSLPCTTDKIRIGRSQPIVETTEFWKGLTHRVSELVQTALSGRFDYPSENDQVQQCERCSYRSVCRAPSRFRGLQP